jgi:hypothetical protein
MEAEWKMMEDGRAINGTVDIRQHTFGFVPRGQPLLFDVISLDSLPSLPAFKAEQR